MTTIQTDRTPCAITGTTPNTYWTAVHCAAHGATAASYDTRATDPATAQANAWANHLFIVERAAREEAESAARLAAAPPAVCDYDSGSATDCVPLCNKPPQWRIVYSPGATFVTHVCTRHKGATLGRLYPYPIIDITALPAGRR